MSALGDYIHLHAENYLKYGVAKRGETSKPFSGIDNLLQNRMSTIKDINDGTIKVLEQRLKNNTIAQENQDKRNSSQDFQKKVDKLYELVAAHSNISSINSYLHGSSGIVKPSNITQIESLALSRGEIERRKALIQEIDLKISEINKNQMATESQINELLNLYNAAGGTKTFSQTGNKSILGQLQDAINEMSYNTWISAVSGEFGEKLVAMCGDKVESLAVDELEAYLKEAVVGDARTSITLSKDKVAKDLSSFLKTDEENNSYYLGTTQDKVDVKIQVKNEEVLANVKHYHNAEKVTLQSRVSLFSALAFLEQYNQFGTHWLNMHAGRLIGNRGSADQTLKEEIAYEALVSGNPLKKGVQGANTFVFIDRATGRVMVKKTKDILTNEINRINIKPNISNIKLKNRYSKTFQDRITGVLMQAHATQLYVSLNVI